MFRKEWKALLKKLITLEFEKFWPNQFLPETQLAMITAFKIKHTINISMPQPKNIQLLLMACQPVYGYFMLSG